MIDKLKDNEKEIIELKKQNKIKKDCNYCIFNFKLNRSIICSPHRFLTKNRRRCGNNYRWTYSEVY